MIGTLVWKEYREHRTVWVAMAALAGLLVGGLTQFLDLKQSPTLTSDSTLVTVMILVILAGTYGLVCGSMLLAGEREAGTLVFLDTQPVQRLHLWGVKLLFGVVLTVAHVLLLLVLVGTLGPAPADRSPSEWIGLTLALLAVAFESLFWGLLSSALCHSVLPAAGLTCVFLAVNCIVFAVVSWPPTDTLLPLHFMFMLAVAALAGSAWIFAGQDVLRRLARVRALKKSPARSSSWESDRRLVWLCLRQGRWRMVGLSLPSVLFGHFVPLYGVVIWPTLTLGIGILCGVAVFAGDQSGGAYRFHGDQRLPVGRLWAVKTAVWGIVALLLAFLALLSGTFFVLTHDLEHLAEHLFNQGKTLQGLLQGLFGAGLLVEGVGRGLFLVLWLVYGFAVGQVFGLLCRKSAVALVLAVLVTPVLLAVWLPSLLAGGVRSWQVLAIPALLLLASRRAVWAWARDQLRGPRLTAGVLGCILLVAAWLEVNLAYRVWEIPEGGEPFDVAAYTASLPSAEKNRAGRLFRLATTQFVGQWSEVEAQLGAAPQPQPRPEAPNAPAAAAGQRGEPEGVPADPGPERPLPVTYADLVNRVLETGWREEDRQLGRWLDLMCAGDWLKHLQEAAAAPLGMVADPLAPPAIGLRYHGILPASLLTARALQLQARGESGAALDYLVVTLVLSRHLRNHAPDEHYALGQQYEACALTGLDHWVSRLGLQPELLKRALTELARHEAELPPATDRVKAQYLAVRAQLANPHFQLAHDVGPQASSTQRFEAVLVTLCAQVPWEKARQTRLLNVFFAGRLHLAETPYWRLPNFPSKEHIDGRLRESWLGRLLPGPDAARQMEIQSHCRLRALRLCVALALYQGQEGQPALALQALVPHYLAELPLDPFSGQPFRYRVSQGERIPPNEPEAGRPEGPAGGMMQEGEPSRQVPAGQGIVWSVGRDGVDGDGLYPEQDRLYFVPQWPKPGAKP